MSSGSESDEDYVPGEPEKLSEEESADDETEKQYEHEVEGKIKKRKATAEKINKVKKSRKSQNDTIIQVTSEKDKTPEPIVDSEQEKKREEDLWAKFLEGTDSKLKPVLKEKSVDLVTNPEKSSNNTVNYKKTNDDDAKEKERRIFEFAGEKIVVENNVIKERLKVDETSMEAIKSDGSQNQTSDITAQSSSSAKPGGLSNVLGQLNKKNRLSTLEKSKLDWVTYKHEEGIDDEIQSHNKGKQGFLDRRDFLERADMRQYEIERELRTSRRSNR